ncbi:MAG: RIP metalloprotease RseP [Rhodobacteraceae bacterium]|nr:RIP metalloprotease RseP [Paracoccaceae bacterium]
MEIFSLIPQFGGLLYTILSFVVVLSVVVAVHEYGHYIVGRWSGIHADVFSIGIGPVLFSRVDKRGTRWQVAALPLGGFVKFKGDSDAASGKDADAMQAAENDPAELRSTMHGAPLWARSLTVAAGPVFNFALSIVVFSAVLMVRGEASDPLAVGEIHNLPAGFHQLAQGDEILAVDGIDIPDAESDTGWREFTAGIPLQAILNYTVRRDGQTLDVEGPYLFPPLANRIAPRSAAGDIGMEAGDVITSVDGTPVFAFDQLKDVVESSDGRTLMLDVWRDGETLEFALAPRRVDEPQAEGGFATSWRIGIAGGMAFEPATSTIGPIEAVQGGVMQTYGVIKGSLSGLWHMITGQISAKNMSGPIGIAETSGAFASQGVLNFIAFIAVLSTAIGLLNLFPIPILDGGHLVFFAYEAIVGRAPSDAALRVLMGTGLAMILSLMVFATWNDVSNLVTRFFS